jgi:hypothetical protein
MDFEFERTLGEDGAVLQELEELLDGCIRGVQAGAVSHRTAKAV